MNDSVSIIIPVYNCEKYILECLESCINQTYDNFDIVVVDDGSTDNTSKIVYDFALNHPHITLISKKNGGTGSALNVGIESSHGIWIKWLSADDKFLFNNSLEMLMSFVKDIGCLYYTNYKVIDEDGELLRYFEEPDRSNMTQKIQGAEMFFNFFGNGSTSLIHRQMFYQVGKFNETMPYNDDYEYWLRWVLKNKLPTKHIPLFTVQYREHSQSLTGTKKANENMELVERLRKDYSKYLDNEQRQYLKTKKTKLSRRLAKKLPGPILNNLMRLKKR